MTIASSMFSKPKLSRPFTCVVPATIGVHQLRRPLIVATAAKTRSRVAWQVTLRT